MRTILFAIAALLATGLGTAEAKRKYRPRAKVTCVGRSAAGQRMLPVREGRRWACRPNGAPILR